MKKVFSLALAACFAVAGVASAGVTGIERLLVDNAAGGAALTGFITNDIEIEFTGQYTGSQLLLELTNGAMYQDGFGNEVTPNGAFIGLAPSLAFDTFVAMGAANDQLGPVPNINGGAVDLGGAASPSMDTTSINLAYGPGGGVDIINGTDFLAARVSLTADAVGSWKYLASADGEIFTVTAGYIESGIMYIPEPATLALFGMGLVGIAFGRRRS